MSDPALVVRARRLRAARGVVVARDVALAAAPGDVVAVEGPNGSGKSTLLAAAAGLLPAGSASIRPGSVGYSPERAGVLPRIPLHRWLLGLARTAGLDRDESARRASDLQARLGLAYASQVPLQALSRGSAQRALVAQALLADPDLLVLDEPAGGLDDDGVTRVAAEIRRAAGRRAVVLVARHPTAPLPLPAGVTWQLRDGGVAARPREGDGPLSGTGLASPPGTMEVETGNGAVQRVDEAGLPAVLRAALDSGQAIRRSRYCWPWRPWWRRWSVRAGSLIRWRWMSRSWGAPGRSRVRRRARLAARADRARLAVAGRRGCVLRPVRGPGHAAGAAAPAEHPPGHAADARASPAAWLFLPGLALVAVAAVLAARLTRI